MKSVDRSTLQRPQLCNKLDAMLPFPQLRVLGSHCSPNGIEAEANSMRPRATVSCNVSRKQGGGGPEPRASSPKAEGTYTNTLSSSTSPSDCMHQETDIVEPRVDSRLRYHIENQTIGSEGRLGNERRGAFLGEYPNPRGRNG